MISLWCVLLNHAYELLAMKADGIQSPVFNSFLPPYPILASEVRLIVLQGLPVLDCLSSALFSKVFPPLVHKIDVVSGHLN